jgi:hypothetical protein
MGNFPLGPHSSTPDRMNKKKRKKKSDPLEDKPLSEIFHFWKLAGGDLENEIQLSLPPPILRMPRVFRHTSSSNTLQIYPPPGMGQWKDPFFIYDDRILRFSLPLSFPLLILSFSAFLLPLYEKDFILITVALLILFFFDGKEKRFDFSLLSFLMILSDKFIDFISSC